MKTNLRFVGLALAAAALAAPAGAQPEPQQPRAGPRLGVGVGLPTNELGALLTTGVTGGGLLPAQLYVPIRVSPRIRIEPQFGVLTLSQDGGDEASLFSLGAGAFYVAALGAQAQFYVGPRFVVSFFEDKNVPGGPGLVTKTKGTDIYFAAALGGELLPHPRIGVGAEAQLGYFSIGDRKATTGNVTVTTPGGSSTQTQGILFLRVYLL